MNAPSRSHPLTILAGATLMALTAWSAPALAMHRCFDAKGHSVFQESACGPGQRKAPPIVSTGGYVEGSGVPRMDQGVHEYPSEARAREKAEAERTAAMKAAAARKAAAAGASPAGASSTAPMKTEVLKPSVKSQALPPDPQYGTDYAVGASGALVQGAPTAVPSR